MDVLSRKLQGLPGALGREVRERALLKGAEPIRETASVLAPRKSGRLSRGVQKEVARNNRFFAGDEVVVAVGVGDDEFYGAFQEFGTVVNDAHPFLRPAYDQRKDEAVSITRRDLQSEVERYAAS